MIDMGEEKNSIQDLLEFFRKLNVKELHNVEIEGDIEIEVDLQQTPIFELMRAIGYELGMAGYHLMNASKMLGYPVEVFFQPPQVAEVPVQVEKEVSVLSELIREKFEEPKVEYPGVIEEIVIGATKADGGTRSNVVKVGGEKSLPFYYFDALMPNTPKVTIDVFDMPITLAKAVREHYQDVMEDPGDWAKKAVKEYNADMITIHLISTDPLLKDTSAKEACKAVEDVLQAVKVPIVIGGSGNPEKDPEVLERAAEVAEGERCLIASASLNMDWERIAKAAKEHGHVILSWTQMDINNQKTLNRYLLNKIGYPRDSIIMDPTTAALGYGLDYAYTNMERIRLSGLKGDKDLAFPMSSGTTNAWGAREAWMTGSPIEGDSDWGPREYRGPIWEVITGLTLALAGGDLFMMMHPGAVAVFKEICQALYGEKDIRLDNIEQWITLEVEE